MIDPSKAEQMPGVTDQHTKRRYYPLKEAAAHLDGYTGKVTKEDFEIHPSLLEEHMLAKYRLQNNIDKELHGTNSREIIIVDEEGHKKQVVQETKKIDGKDVHLTIDAYIQTEAFENLNKHPGSTVVMNPKDGGFYALASSPSF